MTTVPVLLVVELEPKSPPDDVLFELPNVFVELPPPKSELPPVVFDEPNIPPFCRITISRKLGKISMNEYRREYSVGFIFIVTFEKN